MDAELLQRVHDLGSEIDKIVRSRGAGINWRNLFDEPEIVALRDDLLGVLGAADTAKGLIATTAALHLEFRRLLDEDGPLTDERLAKLGAIAAAERALSYQALDAAGTNLAIFVYTMEVIWPAVEALGRLGILIATLAVPA